jgi:hypothetical protein
MVCTGRMKVEVQQQIDTIAHVTGFSIVYNNNMLERQRYRH